MTYRNSITLISPQHGDCEMWKFVRMPSFFLAAVTSDCFPQQAIIRCGHRFWSKYPSQLLPSRPPSPTLRTQ